MEIVQRKDAPWKIRKGIAIEKECKDILQQDKHQNRTGGTLFQNPLKPE